MKIIDCQQRSAEWFAMRCGKVTASNIHRVLAKRKDGKPSAEREAYKLEIVTERLTNWNTEHYVSPQMKDGVEFEDEARESYEEHLHGEGVWLVGFVIHPTIDGAGCSPDGLLPTRGVEIKCPQSTTHIKYLQGGVVPEDYIPQMQWGMACTGLPEWDFVSYDGHRTGPPNYDLIMPKDLRLFVKTLKRDDALIAEYEAEVRKFLAECEEILDNMRNQADIRKHIHA